jgi:hypothetical protein
VFSTCIFCGGSLGRNEVVEAFPVGRRLAFDPARGRLWVLCAGCRQWNLSPLEERWESLERISRDTRARYSTGETSLVRHPEGLDLVRVGSATAARIHLEAPADAGGDEEVIGDGGDLLGGLPFRFQGGQLPARGVAGVTDRNGRARYSPPSTGPRSDR